jgi:TPR repeat protein
MPDVSSDKKPINTLAAGGLWLVAACVGLGAAAAFEYHWPPTKVAGPPTLEQALVEFDQDDMAAAARAFRTLAGQGDANAAYWYGHALEAGLGVPPDPKAALAEYRRAWAGGSPAAARRLGELDISGNLGPPDFDEGRNLLIQAARRGDIRAALDLGRVLRNGIGGPADPAGAYAWLEVASLGGNAEARIERDRLLPKLTQDQQAQAAAEVASLQSATAHADSVKGETSETAGPDHSGPKKIGAEGGSGKAEPARTISAPPAKA